VLVSSSAGIPKRNALLGGIAGLLVGACIAGLLERRRSQSSRTVQRLEKLLDAPMLAEIPSQRSAGPLRRWRLVNSDGASADSATAYASLATTLMIVARRRGYASLMLVPYGHSSAAAVDVGVAVTTSAAKRRQELDLLFAGVSSDMSARAAKEIALACRTANVAAPSVQTLNGSYSGESQPEVKERAHLTILVTTSGISSEPALHVLGAVDALVAVCSGKVDESLVRDFHHALSPTGVPLLGFVLVGVSRCRFGSGPRNWRGRLDSQPSPGSQPEPSTTLAPAGEAPSS